MPLSTIYVRTSILGNQISKFLRRETSFGILMFISDMLTLPLSAEVYRFLNASSAYRFTIQIFRFLSNLPLSNHWVLFTPSD